MTEGDNWIQWALDAALTILLGILAWIGRKLVGKVEFQDRRIDGIENLAQNLRLENKDTMMAIANLRLHVSENYSGKAETNASLSRVHGKIEKLSDDVIRHIEDLRRDIKQDIQNALHNGRNSND